VIVNEKLARQFFPNEDPIGKRIKWSRDKQSTSPWMTVVGIAADVKRWPNDPRIRAEMYAPLRQEPRPYLFLAMRTVSPDPTGVNAALRAEVRKLDSDQPITNIRTMKDLIDFAMAISETTTSLIAIFAGIALLMAAMGIYGVIAYSVAQRTHELGIRAALGAGSGNVIGLVLRQALWLIGIGIAIGMPAAAAVTKFLGTFLYDVNARDPLTFVFTTLVLAVVAVVASYLPAHRAAKLDPVTALRCE
jgi:putative ABC transport system permease protein